MKKFKVTTPFHKTDIPIKKIKESGVSPVNRQRFLDHFKEILSLPSKRIIINALDKVCEEQGINFKEWVVTWEDYIGETSDTEDFYIVEGDESKTSSFYHLTMKKSLEKCISRVQQEISVLKWYNWMEKSFKKEQLQLYLDMYEKYHNATKLTIITPSFTRNWYLTIYY